MFRNQTSSEGLSTFTCASCAESVSLRDHCSVRVGDSHFDLTVLKRPDLNWDETNILNRYKWLHPNCISPPLPFDEDPLRDLLLDPDGVSLSTDGGSPVLSLCKSCHSYLKRKKMPALSLANRTFLGAVPSELKDLTVIEEAMIARCRSKCWILQLKADNDDVVLQSMQRGIKGHIIIYPQQPSKVADVLPPSIEEITAPVCVLFVGSSAPTPEWLREHAKPLAVNATRVRSALLWLKRHNPLYRDIKINEECLQQLEENPVLPFNIEHVRET